MVKISDYHYNLPERLIAQMPLFPRDASRLFVYNTKTDEVVFDHFANLTQYLPQRSFLVMNETKVLPSRIVLHKVNKGKVKTLFLVNELLSHPGTIHIMVDRKVIVGEKLFFNEKEYVEVTHQDKQLFTVRFDFMRDRLYELLLQNGQMPIPLYIKHSPLGEQELQEKYQTIFARAPDGARFGGSAAAPTASLHFTKRVLQKLKTKKIPHCFITLHVGMGTFAPIDEKNIKDKKLHNEWYEIPKETFRSINRSKEEKMGLVAVGTTVVRTLESYSMSLRTPPNGVKQSQNEIATSSFDKLRTPRNDTFNKTSLFIYPPYEFKMVDHLVTNFHLPGSSLMMLVEAFLQHKKAKRSLVDLYKIAIKEKFRFYSFGDAMLII